MLQVLDGVSLHQSLVPVTMYWLAIETLFWLMTVQVTEILAGRLSLEMTLILPEKRRGLGLRWVSLEISCNLTHVEFRCGTKTLLFKLPEQFNSLLQRNPGGLHLLDLQADPQQSCQILLGDHLLEDHLNLP